MTAAALGMDTVLQALGPRMALFGLVLARIGGVFLALPMLSGELVPLRLRAVIAAAMAFVLAMPIPSAMAPQGLAALGTAAIKDLLIGAALGLLIRLALGVAEALGALIAMQMGLGFGAIVDPLTKAEGPLSALFGITAWTILLSINGHHEVLRGLSDSFRALPPGGPLPHEPLVARLVDSTGHMFAAALRIAIPVVATILGTNATMALLARIAPKVNLLLLGFMIAICAGIVALAFAAPTMARAITDNLFRALAQMRAFAAGY